MVFMCLDEINIKRERVWTSKFNVTKFAPDHQIGSQQKS